MAADWETSDFQKLGLPGSPEWNGKRAEAEHRIVEAAEARKRQLAEAAARGEPPPPYPAPGKGKHVFADLNHLDAVVKMGDQILARYAWQVETLRKAAVHAVAPAPDYSGSKMQAKEQRAYAEAELARVVAERARAEQLQNELRAALTQMRQTEEANQRKFRGKGGSRDA
ncbi:hypothetical protein EV193_101489 [Herbihabitans rhizosphaerae]|uniref:Flagellar FliJ protein n=1 Tax=Herbihabitans rhizosphaerae TaxID=1872711 RepID=A0A4V2EUH7_9PSEU|nr:hypothetical protein [Herbihabitans rhizosphaerae]RZS44613.1 hypothetical protein EV193_101489 [Herbihabitans rhizosphaerae]